MKIKLVTLFDEKFNTIGLLSSRVMEAYCARRGYDFVCYRNLPDPSRGAQWNKTRVVQQELPTCDWLVWMDADALPVNHDFSIEKLIERVPDKDLIISGDNNGLCFGIFAVKNCAWSMQFFQTLWFVGQMKFDHAKTYHPDPQFDQVSVVALKDNFPTIDSRIFVLPETFVCNPRTEFRPTCFAVHYWASDNRLEMIARKMNYFIAHGWTPAAHRDIRIITACNGAMADILKISLLQNRDQGYSVHVFDLNGELGKGERFDYPMPAPENGKLVAERLHGKLPCKPIIIRKALAQFRQFIAFMDADAFAIRRFDEVNTGDYDVGVTMRRRAERGATAWPLLYGFVNTGVVFFNHTAGAFQFLDEWDKALENSTADSDQEALNMVVLQATDLTEYDKVFVWKGIRIKIFRCDDYNFYYWPQEPLPNTKIVHCKTNVREAIEDWGNRDWLTSPH
jgi:galactosyl transferase GMA12/MNN10 family/Nucleotide-diphospho-sugar transferase